jgi:endogenous inhibitor of DNA gyrase (YacG/DUF329 family)
MLSEIKIFKYIYKHFSLKVDIIMGYPKKVYSKNEKCISCGEEFIAHNKKEKLCSNRCKQDRENYMKRKNRKENPTYKICPECEKKFELFSIDKNTKYCSKECYKKHRKKAEKIYNQTRYWNNREYMLARSKDEYKNNLYGKRERNLRNSRQLHDKVIDILGGRCANPNCLVPNGCTDKRCLDINHINFGGTKEIREKYNNNGYRFYRDIFLGKRKTNDLEVRCSNCNRIYNWEGKRKERN